MRALGEKVFAFGTVKSRRRKPKVTEATAQTTQVEPASEFDVEREDEPEEATPGHQSDVTIHTSGVKLAKIKQRKRKPKATEPAANGD